MTDLRATFCFLFIDISANHFQLTDFMTFLPLVFQNICTQYLRTYF